MSSRVAGPSSLLANASVAIASRTPPRCSRKSTSDSRPVSCLLSTFDACDLWCIPLSGASHSGVYLREVAVDFRGNRDRESPCSPPASWLRHPMPPKKRQQKPANSQEMPAPTPTRRRTARRRCQDLPTAEDSREANATPSSSPRRLDWSEEAHPKHSPTPFTDTATLFADKANIKIPPFGKNVREVPTSKKSPTPSTATEDKIPSNRVINMDDPPASIPKICIKATPDWHLLLKRIKAELGKPTPASCDGTTCIQLAPATQRDYDTIYNIIIEENFEITGPPRNQPRPKKPQRVLPTPMTPPTKPPTPTPPRAAPQHIPTARTPTPTMSAYAMRDNSPTGASSPMPSEEESLSDASPIRTPTPQMPASREDSPARTPTPTTSASESRDGSPQGVPSPAQYRAESPDTLPSRISTPQMSENTPRDCSPTKTRIPTFTLSTKSIFAPIGSSLPAASVFTNLPGICCLVNEDYVSFHYCIRFLIYVVFQ
ncbi:hypothetical protein ACJJTC_005406 [Scirpophaga incertulas]